MEPEVIIPMRLIPSLPLSNPTVSLLKRNYGMEPQRGRG